jgi:hypothetical protein
VYLDGTIKDQGATLEGEFHTHWIDGFGFSGDDIFSLSYNYKGALRYGFVSIVEAGNVRFALFITDEKLARGLMNRAVAAANRDRYDALVDKYGNNGPESYKKAIVEMFGSRSVSGMQFYFSTDQKNFTAIN